MKYTVFTYIFGENKELLREPLFIDNDVEYICITDNPNLKSSVWKIIYEPINVNIPLRDKVALTKFNPFKYTTAEKIIIQDSSLQIKQSILPLFEKLDNNTDIVLKLHTEVKDLKTELLRWNKIRNLPNEQIKKFELMAIKENIDLDKIPVYECCVLCIKNNNFTKKLFNNLLQLMKFLGDNNKMIMTQQCTFAFLLKILYPNIKISLLEQHIYFNRFLHNTNKVCLL